MPQYAGLIESDPQVKMGKPVVVGTRITVESIVGKLSVGETIEQVLAAHPRLTQEAIQAALGFAADSLRADVRYYYGPGPSAVRLPDGNHGRLQAPTTGYPKASTPTVFPPPKRV